MSQEGIPHARNDFPWTVMHSKRSKRMAKWEQDWYNRWGLSTTCSICGMEHCAMSRVINEEDRVLYEYNCPISMHTQWPPVGVEEGNPDIWESLAASPHRLASHHGYSIEAVAEAVVRWENNGSGLLVTTEGQDSFRNEVHLICEEERKWWTFKRTPILVDIVGYENWEDNPGEWGEERL